MKETSEKIKNSSKGITLIALVITIIVLLILAGVAISMLTGDNGILNQAVKAKEETERKSMQENIQLAVLSAISNTNHDLTLENLETEVKSQLGNDVKVEQDGIGGYVIGKNPDENGHLKDVYGVVDKEGKVGDGKWHFVKLTEAEEANDKEIKISDGKTTLIVGKEINYSPTIDKDGNNFTTEELEDEKYTCSVGNLSDDGSETYTYKADGYKGKWGVLGAEDGKILIASMEGISATTSTGNKDFFAIGGKNGYQNGVKALNDISKIYGYGKGAEGARSITVEDINKITGYDPNYEGQNVNKTKKEELKLKRYREGTINEYGNQVKYYWGKNGNIIYKGNNGINGGLQSSLFTWYNTNRWIEEDKPTNLNSPKYITSVVSTIYDYSVEQLKNYTADGNEIGIGNNQESSGKEAYKLLVSDKNYWLSSIYMRPVGGKNDGAEYGIFYMDYDDKAVSPFWLCNTSGVTYERGGSRYTSSHCSQS